jgi:hypothetical protein
MVTDEQGIEIGYTSGPVAKRIAVLQTGYPRTIYALVTIHGAAPEVEAKLHTAFAEQQGIGEWFKWPPLIALTLDAGGWEALLRKQLGEGEWTSKCIASGRAAERLSHRRPERRA